MEPFEEVLQHRYKYFIFCMTIFQEVNCSMYLVFNSRAVSWPFCFHPTTICWCFMQVVSDNLVCFFCCACQVATHLLPFYVEIRIKAKPIYLFKTAGNQFKKKKSWSALNEKKRLLVPNTILLLNL